MLVVDALPTSVREQVSSRLRRADLGRWLAQVEQVGHCAKPIRLVGTSDTINPVTATAMPATVPRNDAKKFFIKPRSVAMSPRAASAFRCKSTKARCHRTVSRAGLRSAEADS